MHPHGTYHSIYVSSKNIINSMIKWWKFSLFIKKYFYEDFPQLDLKNNTLPLWCTLLKLLEQKFNFCTFRRFIKRCLILVIFYVDVCSCIKQQSGEFTVVFPYGDVQWNLFKSILSVHISSLEQQTFDNVSSVVNYCSYKSCKTILITHIHRYSISQHLINLSDVTNSR